MKTKGRGLHTKGLNAIKKTLDDLLENIPQMLEQVFQAVVKQMKEDVKSFFENNTSAGSRVSSRKVINPAKMALRLKLLRIIGDLKLDWAKASTAKVHVYVDDEDVDLDQREYFDPNQTPHSEYED